MKTTTNTDSDEVILQRRMRLLGEWFAGLASRVDRDAIDQHGMNLPAEVIAEIDEQHFDRADLMAMRNTPGKWHHDPYVFLWILHRYQNTGH